MNSKAKSNALGSERAFRYISYVLMFLMLTCVAMAIGGLIHNLIPNWHSSIIAGVILLIVIDRLYTYRRFKELTPLSTEWTMTLGTHWIVFAVFIRLLLSYANGSKAFVNELSLFARGDVEAILSVEFLATLFFAILAWLLPRQFLELLDEIGLDQKLALREDGDFVPQNLVPAHQRLVNLIFGNGIALVILAALARLNLQATLATLANPADFAAVELNGFTPGEAGVLFYFIFGLALLSLSRLMSLQTRWNRQRIPMSSNSLVRQWGLYSLLFLFLLAFIISLLPAGNSLGFISVIGTLLGFLIGVFAFLVELIFSLIVFLFSLPFLLFGKASPIPNNQAIQLTLPPLPVQHAGPPTSNAIWEIVKSVLLWGSLVLIIVFSIVSFIRQHENLSKVLGRSRATNWLLLAWQWLRKNMERTRETVSHTVAEGWQRVVERFAGRRILPRPNLISLRALDPRRRVYFFYLAMIRRGDEQGLTRKPSQTPSEYAVTLEKALPSAEEDIDSITEAFVEARYSRQEVDARKADLVRATWGRIRRALQTKSKSESSANK